MLSLDFRQQLLHAVGRGGKRHKGERNQARTALWSHAKVVSARVLAVSPRLAGDL